MPDTPDDTQAAAEDSAAAASSPALSPATPDPYADDSPLTRRLRVVDNRIGLIEQVILVSLLGIVVLTSLGSEVAYLIRGKAWTDSTTVIKYGVFAMAMLGGAYAAHHRRLLSLDLVSRMLAPRRRAVLRVVLAAYAIFIAAVAIWGGLKVFDVTARETHAALIPIKVPALFIPIGFGLLAFHLAVQVAIEIDYLRRGKTAPEAEQGVA